MFNTEHLIQAGGLLAIGLAIFAESGILLGLFLPGDTLLLTAGLFAGQGKLSLFWLMAVVLVAAISGYEVGYIFGERLGPRLFKRRDGILLRQDYIVKTQQFFDKYGALTVVLARFVAHLRTLVSLIAGAAGMNKRAYLLFNVLGAILWTVTLVMLGYWLGASVPNIDKYFFPIVIVVILLLYGLVFWGFAKSPTRRAAFRKGIREDWDYFIRHKG